MQHDPAPLARLGEPDAVFGPSPGQTAIGVILGAVIAALGFAFAALGHGLDVGPRVFVALFGAAGLALVWWVWRMRRWRLAVGPGGLVQVGLFGVDELRWADAVEVIDTRHDGQTVRVRVVGRAARITVNPLNSRARQKIFAAVLDAAVRAGVAVRVEVQEGD